MPTTLSHELQQTARAFHALSDETRLRVIEMLRHGERCVCDLTAALDLAQPRLSFHLKTLKDAGILHDRRSGRWIYYSLNPKKLAELEASVSALARSAAKASRLDQCCG